MPTEAFKELLLNEYKEINNWNRHMLQLYYAWFTVFVSANVLAQAWLFQYPQSPVLSSKAVFVSFTLSNLLGIMAAARLQKYVAESSTRVAALNAALAEENDSPRLASPIPVKFVTVGLIASSLGMALFAAVWVILIAAPRNLLSMPHP